MGFFFRGEAVLPLERVYLGHYDKLKTKLGNILDRKCNAKEISECKVGVGDRLARQHNLVV